MTELLYYKDPYVTEFKAKVVSCTETDKGYAVVLDRTSFFPEQGGQYPDEGTLDGIEVSDVRINGGEITHYLPEKLPEGAEVTGKVNFEKRFDRMQNHTGEHIVCGIIHNKYGFENVGFHLADDLMTMDTSGILTQKQLDEVEKEANRVIFADIPIEILCPSPEELADIQYRSKLDIKENVRLVKIPGVDICACCAPHVGRTGEVGMIKIVKAMKYKGGMRLNLCCGMRAYDDYLERYRITEHISAALSVKPYETAAATDSLSSKIAELKNELRNARKENVRMMTAAMAETDENVCLNIPEADNDILREAVNLSMEKSKGLCIAYTGTDGSYSFVMGRREGDMAPVKDGILKELCGRGGGRGNMISGTLGCDEIKIKTFFEGYVLE